MSCNKFWPFAWTGSACDDDDDDDDDDDNDNDDDDDDDDDDDEIICLFQCSAFQWRSWECTINSTAYGNHLSFVLSVLENVPLTLIE